MDKQRTEQAGAVKSDYGWRTGQREGSIAAGLPAGIPFKVTTKLLIYLVMLIKLVKNIEIPVAPIFVTLIQHIWQSICNR